MLQADFYSDSDEDHPSDDIDLCPEYQAEDASDIDSDPTRYKSTFITSWIAVYIGRVFGLIFGTKINIVGGVILIGIGVKVCLEHFAGGF